MVAPIRKLHRPNNHRVRTKPKPIERRADAGKETVELAVEQILLGLDALVRGDFTARLPIHWTGVTGRISDRFNELASLNQRFVGELCRLSRVVGKEGQMKERFQLGEAEGKWGTACSCINELVQDLVQPTREMARVIGAVARGDLSETMQLEIGGQPVKGEFRSTAKTVNTMVDQLGRFASEVTRVAREVGTEGKLGGQAKVRGVAGTWKDLTDNVNLMASNLTSQVRNIAKVTTAVANGDLTKKITVDVRGEIAELKDTVNTMVDQLRSFASEVTRVAREVGTEGNLGGQARVEGVSGTWKALTDSVNFMASNLTSQVRNIAEVTTAVANGDLSKKVTVNVKGEIKKLKETVNRMVEQLSSFADEVTRVAREVGTEGKLGGQAQVEGVAGRWKDLTDSVNFMAGNLTSQVRNIAAVTTAVANGDLSRKITVDVKGEILQLKETINTLVDQLSSFASEVTRVAREVGTEGILGGQAYVSGVAGTWKDLTDSVNSMARNLTAQVRNIATVTTAVANGDLSKKVTVDVKGEIKELKETVNTMVDQLSSFADEVTRVAREVGTEGKLGGQAQVGGVAGRWKDLTDSVNFMAGNLTSQVRNIAAVTTAVAKGDLSKKITVDVKGEILELKDTINTMVDQLGSFASEVTRVAREVGTEGRLGGQAEVKGVGGTWKDLTESVNSMAGNLTSQVRNIAEVTTAVAKGDLSKKITVDVKGEILELKNTFNTMVDQLSSFASEVTRVAREVGTEGKLGGQADVHDAAGTWKDLTVSVNSMASNLTAQVRNIADVTTAVANGDLSKKITVDVKGEILQLKNTINTMVDQLRSFASEVTRVAREVGTEGKLGGQAVVKDVAGTWKDLTDSVNSMAGNLTSQVRNIAEVTTAVARGDLSKKITVDVKGEILELKNTVNTMVDQLRSFAAEVTRVAREVGTEGKLGGQADVRGLAGTWKDLTDSVNFMAGNLTSQVRNIAAVTTAVANGDLTRKITVDVQGEILELKNTINTMVDQLSSFASEVTRVAREVGTEGKLGGQAEVKGVSGIWKDLTENVNFMASNLTSQVREIAKVMTAVARGDLKRKLLVQTKGEISELAETINQMIETLATYADQVTTVAREVGVEGKLGGQANVPGAAGTWRDLTENVNQLAANLTTQVRAIADVATAVTKGDLTRFIEVHAEGEVAALKDNINEMIRNLKEQTIKNHEQDWLKTNVAKFTRMLQGQKDPGTVGKLILTELAPVVSSHFGRFYTVKQPSEAGKGELLLEVLASYAARNPEGVPKPVRLGEGVIGETALGRKRILLRNLPANHPGGSAGGANLIALPISFEGVLKAVIELASYEEFSPSHQALLDQLTESMGIVLHTLEANTRTENLLQQSQSLARELQQSNQALEEKAALLVTQNREVEQKNREVEQARQALEGKARQLVRSEEEIRKLNEGLELRVTQRTRELEAAVTNLESEIAERKRIELALQQATKVSEAANLAKSQFLANMSHELRTPLNAIIGFSEVLTDLTFGPLNERQIKYINNILTSGRHLLQLINDILDLAKIEAGRLELQRAYFNPERALEAVQTVVKALANKKSLAVTVEIDPKMPNIYADQAKFKQVMYNLLSNAIKFTPEKGKVTVTAKVEPSETGGEQLRVSVADTGIGLKPEDHARVFQEFEQVDSSYARQQQGTGLGLTLTKKLVEMHGGKIWIESEGVEGKGSNFTFTMPLVNEQTPANAHATPSAGRKPLILVVEDDQHASHLLERYLSTGGYEVATAYDGERAVEMARELKPYAITLDIILPTKSGWEVLAELKTQPETRDIPVVVVSITDDRQLGFSLGAIEWLGKPVIKERLLDAITHARLAKPGGLRSVLIVDDDPMTVELLDKILRQEGYDVLAASGGEEGIKLAIDEHPDLIILDLVMPGVNGFDVVERLRANPQTKEIPILVHTSSDVSAEDRAALRKNVQGITSKSAREQLLQELERFASLKGKSQTPPS